MQYGQNHLLLSVLTIKTMCSYSDTIIHSITLSSIKTKPQAVKKEMMWWTVFRSLSLWVANAQLEIIIRLHIYILRKVKSIKEKKSKTYFWMVFQGSHLLCEQEF